MRRVGWGRLLLWLCRGWYALLGGAAVAWSVAIYLGALASGCRVEFGRLQLRSADLDECVHRIDTPFMVVLGVGGLLLLCAAMWVNERAGAERSIAAVGIAVGGLASLLPGWWAFAIASYYGVTDIGTWLSLLLVAGSPGVVGLSAAVGMAIALARAREGGEVPTS